MTVRHYKHTDAGAPAMSGQVGAMIAVVRACLVDGFGALPGAGWTVAYEDAPTNRIAFRQPVGISNENYLWLDDSAADTADVKGYRDMTAINTGTGPFFSAARTWRKSAASSSAVRAWSLYADDAGGSFWLFVNINNATTPPNVNGGYFVYGFGDVDQFDFAADLPRSWMLALSNSSTCAWVQAFTASELHVDRGEFASSAGTPGSVLVDSSVVTSASARCGRADAGYVGAASIVSAGRILIDIASPPRMLGYLPGLYLASAREPVAEHGSIVTGPDGLSGRDLIKQAVHSLNNENTSLRNGIWYLDMTGPWV